MKRLILGIAVCLVSVNVGRAQDITYNLVDYPADESGESIAGQITTDGTIGPLSGGNVLSWSYEINGYSAFGYSNSGNSGSYNFVIRGLSATSTQLLLPLGNYPADYNLVVMPSDPQGASGMEWVNATNDPATSGGGPIYAANVLGEGWVWHTDNPQMGGTQPWVIAQTVAVPEPSTFALLTVGAIGLLRCAWRKRRKASIEGRCSTRKAFAVLAVLVGFSGQPALADTLYEADSYSGNIYEFTANGTRSTFGKVSSPNGLAFDNNGNLFVVDDNSGDIYEFTPNGTRSIFASGLNTTIAAPEGLAFDGNGNLFEADGSGNIYEFTPNGTRSTFASGVSPMGLAFDGNGNLFEADDSGKIYEFTPDGSRSTFASGVVGVNSTGLTFSDSGDLFEASSNSKIYEFTPSGGQSTFASGFRPMGLAFDSDGNLFVGDYANRIYEFTPGGTQSTFASGLEYPEFLAFAPTPTPEPSTIALLSAGAIGLFVCRWRRQNRPLWQGAEK